jgi:hypothetical protein
MVGAFFVAPFAQGLPPCEQELLALLKLGGRFVRAQGSHKLFPPHLTRGLI